MPHLPEACVLRVRAILALLFISSPLLSPAPASAPLLALLLALLAFPLLLLLPLLADFPPLEVPSLCILLVPEEDAYAGVLGQHP